MKKLYFLYNPSAANAEILDSVEMTAKEAVQDNMRLRNERSDNRWVLASLWDDEVEYANGPSDEYYQDHESDCF